MGALQERNKQSMMEFFADKVSTEVGKMSGNISEGEARRLTYNLVTAANDSIEKGGNKFLWTNQNTKNFVAQLVLHVSAGLDAMNGEVYAYPYGNTMSVQPSYRGYRKMMKKYSVGRKVVDMLCFSVRENEEFSVEYAAVEDKWSYKSKAFNDSKIVGYVTVIVFEDGCSRVMEHTLADIEKRRRASRGKSPAWENWPEEMARAKAIKRHAKMFDIEIDRGFIDTMQEIDRNEDRLETIDITPEDQPEDEQTVKSTIDDGDSGSKLLSVEETMSLPVEEAEAVESGSGDESGDVKNQIAFDESWLDEN